jgi:hypothetical protein
MKMKRYQSKFKESLNLTASEKNNLKRRLITYRDVFDNSKVTKPIDITSLVDYYVQAEGLPPRAKMSYLKLNYNLPENKKKLYKMIIDLIDFLS